MAFNDKTEKFGLDDDANVEDFMSRFSNPDTHVPPSEAAKRFDQFNQARHPEFDRAVKSYISQADPDTFTRAAQNLNPDERTGLAAGLKNALQNAGVDVSGIARSLGLSTDDPRTMQADDLGRLAGYAQQQAPSALQQTAQEQPFFLKALGNPLVQGALAIMAARYLSKRNR
ncbi:MAG TPA: hypothetical protein PK880_09265 [Candidatus Competibacter sp.]|mgnify:CR=1 FL=1|nr:hypothetical protein [Candidatus Competibacter sp.]